MALHYIQTPAGGVHPAWDDSFITLNFARNLAEHGKLSFDGESWSTGATSLLHVCLLALPIRLGIDPMNSTMGIGLLSHAFLVLAVYWLGWAVFRSHLAAFCAALLIAVSHWAAFDAGGGLETGLFMALVASSFAAFLAWKSDGGRLAAGALMALAILTRPEGALLLPATLVYLWLDRQEGATPRSMSREAILLAAPGALALAAQVAFSVAVTESWSPGTATAKMHFFQEYNYLFAEKIRISGEQIGLFAGSILSVLVLAAVGARRKEAVLFGLFCLPLLVLYVMLLPGGLGHYFHRYQHPLLPAIAVLAGGGLATMITAILARGIVEKALLVSVLFLLAVPMWQQYENWRRTYGGAVFDLRGIEAMALDLNDMLAQDEKLAAHDIGAIGYYADYEIVDLVGLVNPEVVSYNQDRTLNTYLEGVRPDYLLTFYEWDVWFLWLGASDRPTNFELVKRYDHGPDGASPYYLYRIHYPLE